MGNTQTYNMEGSGEGESTPQIEQDVSDSVSGIVDNIDNVSNIAYAEIEGSRKKEYCKDRRQIATEDNPACTDNVNYSPNCKWEYLQQKSSDKLKGRCTRDKKLDQEVKDYLDQLKMYQTQQLPQAPPKPIKTQKACSKRRTKKDDNGISECESNDVLKPNCTVYEGRCIQSNWVCEHGKRVYKKDPCPEGGCVWDNENKCVRKMPSQFNYEAEGFGEGRVSWDEPDNKKRIAANRDCFKTARTGRRRMGKKVIDKNDPDQRPKGKTCIREGGDGCCLDDEFKEHCDWVPNDACRPKSRERRLSNVSRPWGTSPPQVDLDELTARYQQLTGETFTQNTKPTIACSNKRRHHKADCEKSNEYYNPECVWLKAKVDKKTGKKYPHGCIAKNRVDDLILREIDELPDDFDSQLQNAINSNIERGMSGESEFNYGFQQGIKYVLEYLQ